MSKSKAWVAPAMKMCMNTYGECPANCPGYEHCMKEGADIMTEGGKLLDQKDSAVETLMEVVGGGRKVHLYFATKALMDENELPEDGYIAHVNHAERKYIRLIDSMVYGTAVYSRRLAPWEIVRAKLTSAPVE